MAVLVDVIVLPGLEEPVTLVVDASRVEKEGELEVVVVKSETGEKEEDAEVQVDCKDEEMKEYSIKMTPSRPERYSVTLTYAGEEVEGASPLELNLCPPKSKEVRFIQPPTGKIRAGQSIDMVFDTFPGGRGEMTAKCTGETAGDIPVHVTRKGISMEYKVMFLPPQEDIYSLEVFFSGHLVKGAPYRIDLIPVDPNKVECSKPVIPEEFGAPIEMNICTQGAGNAKLKPSCQGKECGTVPVSIDKVSKDNYLLKFVPPERDVFTLSLQYGGKNVKDSPFIIDIAPKPELVELGELHVPGGAGTGEDVWVDVDCSKAGSDEVKANCRGQNKEGEIPVTVENCGPDKFRLKFTPALPDVYSLTLFLGSEVIPNGTFDINLLPKSNSKLVKHLGTYIPDSHSEPVLLTFDASMAGEGEMRARVNGISLAGPVSSDVELVNQATSEYQVAFVPDGADTYNVDVYWCDKTIPGSPIYVKIVYPNEVVLTGPVEPELMQPVKIAVDTKLAGPGDLSVSCTGENTGDIETEILRDDYDNTQYEVSFRPIEADLYTFRLFFNDVEVKQSPVEVDLRSPEESTDDVTTPTPTELEMSIGQPLTLSVDSVEEESSLTAVSVGETVGEVPVSVSPNGPEGSFTVTFDPSDPDVYTVDVKQGGRHVPGSPFIVTYKKPPTPEPAEEIPTHPITKPYLIEYVPHDDSLGGVVAYAIHDDSCTRKPLTIQKRGMKTLLALRAEKPGIHIIHVLHNREEIHGSPFKLDIIPADPLACKVVSIPDKAYLGEEVNVIIDTSGAGTADMHVIASVPPGGAETVFSHKENSAGNFVIKFTPIVTGKHKLNVKWAGTVIPDSPIPVTVVELTEGDKQARDAASRVTVYTKEVFNTPLTHSEGAHFYISTEKAGQGDLTIKAKGPGDAKIDVIRVKTAMYRCVVKPTISGRYHLEILWNGFPVPGHPYQLDFIAKATYIINHFDLESETFVIGKASEYVIDCSQEDGDLDVTADPSDCAEVDVTPVEGRDKVFRVKITPQQQGNHEISVRFAEQHVLLSPYHVQFESMEKVPSVDQEDNKLLRLSGIDFPIDLSDSTPGENTAPSIPAPSNSDLVKVTAFGPGLEGGVIGQEGNFTIKTEKAGVGKLDVVVHGACGSFQTKLRRHPDSERTVLARYNPTFIGMYTIDIMWLDEHIEGSPFVVNIKGQEAE
jgi:filamin